MPIMIRILNDIVGRYNFESIGIILDIAAVKMHLQIKQHNIKNVTTLPHLAILLPQTRQSGNICITVAIHLPRQKQICLIHIE